MNRFCLLLLMLGMSWSVRADSPEIPYPFNFCLVSGKSLEGSMGVPVVIHYKNHEIKFCCRGCIKSFYENPEYFLKKMAALQNEQGLPLYKDHIK